MENLDGVFGKNKRGISIKKEEILVFVFVEYMIVYVENLIINIVNYKDLEKVKIKRLKLF